MIPRLREIFNSAYSPKRYAQLLAGVEFSSGIRPQFRVAETPVFVPRALLDEMADLGAQLLQTLLADPAYLAAARAAIPAGFSLGGETSRPHFLTADFALARAKDGEVRPMLVELQAFPSIYGLQPVLANAYREAYELPASLGVFLGALDEELYWQLLRRTIVGDCDPARVILTELDPGKQKTRPDFEVTAKRLGIQIADIRSIEGVGDKLSWRDALGDLQPIDRIYNRAIADELIARNVQLKIDLTRAWNVQWAGHLNWYFLVSKFSVPYLWRSGAACMPPAVFLDEFLAGPGREELQTAGVELPSGDAPYDDLLLKPLFGFAGKGIEFGPTQARMEAIPAGQRSGYLLQKRMHFEKTVATPQGPTQAEFRILYLWPDGGDLTPALALARLGRGKMMGVDHNRQMEWVGASAVFFEKG